MDNAEKVNNTQEILNAKDLKLRKTLTKFIIGCIVVIIGLIILCIVGINNIAKLKISTKTTNLITAVGKNSYTDIRKNLKHADGSELSNTEVTNFLINSDLYRTMLVSEQSYNYVVSKDYFDNSGSVEVTLKACNGDVIVTKFDYYNNGKDYLVYENLENYTKSKKKFYVELNLIGGNIINFNNTYSDSDITIYTFGSDDNGTYFEVFEDEVEDLKSYLVNKLNDISTSFMSSNRNYKITWNNDLSMISVYIDKDNLSRLMERNVYTYMELGSIMLQGFKGISDWHLIINYYDYQSNDLIKSESIR